MTTPSSSEFNPTEPPKSGRGPLIAVLACVGGVLVLAALMFFVVVPALTSSGSDPAAVASSAAPSPGTPSRASANGGFALGAEGVAGSTNDDAVRVDVYLDYMCPLCAEFENYNAEALDELRTSGDITLVVHPVSILDRMSLGTNYSTRAAAAAAYVAEAAPEQFADFSAALLAGQPEEGTTGLTDAEIAAVAKDAGVPDAVVSAIEGGTATETYGQWVSDATNAAAADPAVASSRGFGTPTIVVGGERFEGNWTDPRAVSGAVEDAS